MRDKIGHYLSELDRLHFDIQTLQNRGVNLFSLDQNFNRFYNSLKRDLLNWYRNPEEVKEEAIKDIQIVKEEKEKPMTPPDFSSSVNRPSRFISYLREFVEPLTTPIDMDWRIPITHSALETGWGAHVLSWEGKYSFNFFNIKGEASNGYVILPNALEFDSDGNRYYHQNAKFRAYHSPTESVVDYLSLIERLYPNAWNNRANYRGFFNGLVNGPRRYATDPSFVERLLAVYRTRLLGVV